METSGNSLQERFPDPQSIFRHDPSNPEDIKDECLVIVDTNVLLAPYSTSSKGLNELENVYKRLILDNRLIVPAHVAREFAKNRSEKLHNIHQKLHSRKSQKPDFSVSGGDVEDPVIREMEAFDDLSEAADNLKEAWKEYDNSLDKLIKQVRDWNWNDPVTEMYNEIFDDEIVKEADINEEKLEEEFEKRDAHKIPPGYKDSGKESNKKGDLIIWFTIMSVAEERNLDAVFVTGERKADWWVGSEGVVLCPRFELVNEFARNVDGKSFHIMQIGNFLRLFDVEEDVVEDLEKEDSLKSITRDVFLEELGKLEDKFSSEDGFVSLNYLVKTHLGGKNYRYSDSFDMVDDLFEEGVIELYKVPNPEGQHATTAIRIKSEAT